MATSSCACALATASPGAVAALHGRRTGITQRHTTVKVALRLRLARAVLHVDIRLQLLAVNHQHNCVWRTLEASAVLAFQTLGWRQSDRA